MRKKQWNKHRQQWEVLDDDTGEVLIVTYTVSWTKEGVRYSKDFTDVDNGYDFYERMRKNWDAYDVEWKHNDGFD